MKAHNEPYQPLLSLNIVRITDMIPGVERIRQQPPPECPTLEGLAKILCLLYKLQDINRTAYVRVKRPARPVLQTLRAIIPLKEAAYYYLGSLYVFLTENRQRQVDDLKRNRAIDNDGRAVDINHLRGNVLHDTMFLIHFQLVALDEYFACAAKGRDVPEGVTSIGKESFETISRAAAVACYYADMYFGTLISTSPFVVISY